MNVDGTYTSLDEAMRAPGAVRELSLRNQKLRSLPKQMAGMEQLEVLDLSVNPLGKLPEWVFGLPRLRVLRADCIGLEDVPASIGSLAGLEELTLGGFDRFAALPAEIASLRRLRRLDLTDSTRLRALPELTALTALEEVCLIRTRSLTSPEEALTRLPRLRSLLLDNVPLRTFADEPGALAGLRRLRLSGTDAARLPAWIGELDQLESLYIEDNESLEELPAELGELRELRDLYIGLSKDLPLPATLGKLRKLESLCLVSCQLTEIPTWVFALASLQSLYIALNPIVSVPPEIARLRKLASFDMGYNPEVLPQLAEIQRWLPQCDVVIEGD